MIKNKITLNKCKKIFIIYLIKITFFIILKWVKKIKIFNKTYIALNVHISYILWETNPWPCRGLLKVWRGKKGVIN